MGLFPIMEALMTNKTFILTEGLTMFIKLRRLLPSMDSLINDKVSIGTESFPTLISTIRFLTCEVPDVGKGFYSDQGLPHSLHPEGFSPVWAI